MDAAGSISAGPTGLRLLPPHIGASHTTLAALQREFARVRALDHPHIARVVELGSNGSQYYVRSQRLEGVSLRAVVTHLLPERVDTSEADEIVLSIGSALVYAHAHGVAHGDVRADNVLITMDRRFLLTNFLAVRGGTSSSQPTPSDDLKGIARLAAELYVGARSGEELRRAAVGDVPAARLNAVRAVLEVKAPDRPTSVAEFLAAADLPFGGARNRRTPPERKTWAARLVVPLLATVLVLAIVGISYQVSTSSTDEAPTIAPAAGAITPAAATLPQE